MRIVESKLRTKVSLILCLPVMSLSGFGVKDTLPSGFPGSSAVKNPLAMQETLF